VNPKDTALKKRMVRPEAVDSAVRDAISGGRAIAVQDIRNGENNSGVIVERLMPVKGAADVKRLTGLLSYASDAERTKAQESLSLYLKDRANYDSVREKLAVLLDVALSSGQAELRGRRLVLLLTNGEDVFSMGFALVHAGNNNIYLHQCAVKEDDYDKQMLSLGVEYAARLLSVEKAKRSDQRIVKHEFRKLRNWWSGIMKANFDSRIDALEKTMEKNGLNLDNLRERIKETESFQEFLGVWNEFRGIRLLIEEGYHISGASVTVTWTEGPVFTGLDFI